MVASGKINLKPLISKTFQTRGALVWCCAGEGEGGVGVGLLCFRIVVCIKELFEKGAMFSNTRILLLDVFEGIFEKDSVVLQGFEGDSRGIWVHDIDTSRCLAGFLQHHWQVGRFVQLVLTSELNIIGFRKLWKNHILWFAHLPYRTYCSPASINGLIRGNVLQPQFIRPAIWIVQLTVPE